VDILNDIVGWSFDEIKPKAMKLVFVASLLRPKGERVKTGLFGIRIVP
jgi:hypothetical protein